MNFGERKICFRYIPLLSNEKKILGQKFLQRPEISTENWYFSLKMHLSRLKWLSRNFCTWSEISAKIETLHIFLKHVSVSQDFIYYIKRYVTLNFEWKKWIAFSLKFLFDIFSHFSGSEKKCFSPPEKCEKMSKKEKAIHFFHSKFKVTYLLM